MKVLTVCKKNEIILVKAGLADNFITRFRGLMFRKNMPEDSGLLIVPCNQIHTFNMKFPIDTVYLSQNNEVVRIDASVMPGKVCKIEKQAKKVLELNGGIAEKVGIKVGDTIFFNTTEK